MSQSAIQKIDKELAAYKGDKYGNAMKDYVAGVLKVITTLNSSVSLHSSVAAKFEDFGKTVFRSYEEAEAALGGDGDG